MRKLWIKFSDERNRKYSIKTTIYREETSGKKLVSKEAIFPEGIEHLHNILNYYSTCEKIFPNCKMCPAEYQNDILWFEYIEGESLEDKYRIAYKEKNESLFCDLLKLHVSLICGNEENSDCIFSNSPEFESIFGIGKQFEGEKGLKISNFDAIASNIIFTSDSIPTFIDYEWFFLMPLPKELIIFHCIKDLYIHIHGLEEFFPLQKAMDYLEISNTEETLDYACKHFFHNVVTEPDGKSFAGTKQVCLQGEQDVQYYIEDAKHAHEEWAICAKNWQDAVKAYDELKKSHKEIEDYWKQASQANAQLNNELLSIQKLLADKTYENQIYQQNIEHWKQAYETVINSKTWRFANKVKRIFGRGR